MRVRWKGQGVLIAEVPDSNFVAVWEDLRLKPADPFDGQKLCTEEFTRYYMLYDHNVSYSCYTISGCDVLHGMVTR